jgi:DNA mismatch endonuclease, patch repair protein
MRANRKTETLPERLLRRELWRLGLRYRKNVARLPGNPDIAFAGQRVLVFCDGDFWHGRNWRTLKRKLKTRHNPHYWIAKIARNIARDREHTARLQKAGWTVVRVWETEVKRDPAAVARQIKAILDCRREAATRFS